MVAAMEQNFGREIKVETIEDEVFEAQLKKFGVGEYRLNGLLKMFKHYNDYGFAGNPNVLKWVLGRKPNDFSSFIFKTLNSEK